MKFLCITLFTLFAIITTAQINKHPNQKIRDVNDVKGNQTINNYYYTINYNYNNQLSAKENAISATRGFFKKAKDKNSSIPIIKFGGTISYANTHAFVFEGNPIDPINVTKAKGEINIEAVLRDSKGDEYARINGDSWEISNTNNIEYNNDGSAIEIRSGKRVIFQLEIIKDTVFCYGMCCSEDGFCFYGDQQGKLYTPQSTDYKPSQRFVLPSDMTLQSIFKYPRFEYLGVRDTTQRTFNRVIK